VLNFLQKPIKARLPFKKEGEISGVDYFRVGKGLYGVNEIGEFINILHKRMSDIMIWGAYKMKENREEITTLMIDEMAQLFIERRRNS